MGKDPFKEIKKAADNAVKEVSKGFNNVVTETAKGVQLAGQITGNVGTIVGGDVGKVINAATAPIGATVQAGGDLLKGDIKGAVARQTGAFLAAGSAPISASSTVEDVARNPYVNNFFGGMTNDIAEVNLASRRMIRDGEIKSEDWSAMGRLGVRTAVIVGSAGAAVAAGPKLGAGIAKAATAAGTVATTVGGSAATTVATREISRLVDQPKQVTTAPPVAKASTGSMLPIVVTVGLGSLALIFLKKGK